MNQDELDKFKKVIYICIKQHNLLNKINEDNSLDQNKLEKLNTLKNKLLGIEENIADILNEENENEIKEPFLFTGFLDDEGNFESKTEEVDDFIEKEPGEIRKKIEENIWDLF